MISFDTATGLIARQVSPLGRHEQVALADAAGRILAEPVAAAADAPRHPVAMMDGFAVLDSATRADASLQIIGEARPGAPFAGRVAAGQTVRIFTGAPMPDGADRCIMQEYATRAADGVRFADGYGPAWHVRAAGSDFAAGAVLLATGARLTPRALVTTASADVAQLSVVVSPRVAIIGTGDELAPPGEAGRRAHAIPDSVTFGVAAMVEQAGGHIVARHTSADDLAGLTALAGDLLDQADLVVVTGGASVGDRDFAKPMFAAHGLDLVFAKLAIRPGRPAWLGRARGKWVMGLPGNPTSAMVTARLLLLPLLARLQGQDVGSALRWRRLPLAGPIGPTDTRETFVRARWDDAGLLPLSNQDSGVQGALADADWLIRCPPGRALQASGALVDALAF